MLFFFFFNDTATTEIYTLSLHDALPICENVRIDVTYRVDHPKQGKRIMHSTGEPVVEDGKVTRLIGNTLDITEQENRSEEHTSELQSQSNLVCRLLLEKKKQYTTTSYAH